MHLTAWLCVSGVLSSVDPLRPDSARTHPEQVVSRRAKGHVKSMTNNFIGPLQPFEMNTWLVFLASIFVSGWVMIFVEMGTSDDTGACFGSSLNRSSSACVHCFFLGAPLACLPSRAGGRSEKRDRPSTHAGDYDTRLPPHVQVWRMRESPLGAPFAESL